MLQEWHLGLNKSLKNELLCSNPISDVLNCVKCDTGLYTILYGVCLVMGPECCNGASMCGRYDHAAGLIHP